MNPFEGLLSGRISFQKHPLSSLNNLIRCSLFFYSLFHCLCNSLSIHPFLIPRPTLFLHLPRSHYENPTCPHWLRCLDVSQQAMPVIQLCAMAPDVTGLNSLTCFPLYLIGMVWLQEWRLRGDRMGLLRNSIELCSLVLQRLSERWASAGIFPFGFFIVVEMGYLGL